MKKHCIGLAVFVGMVVASPAWPEQTGPSPDGKRGELLYTTHCIACHTTQVHWRENKLAYNWRTLVAQVRRWQANEELQWNDEDIRAVTRYLNTLYYHFPEEEKTASSNGAKKP